LKTPILAPDVEGLAATTLSSLKFFPGFFILGWIGVWTIVMVGSGYFLGLDEVSIISSLGSSSLVGAFF
jgi:hypothetical protein